MYGSPHVFTELPLDGLRELSLLLHRAF